jgi:two-component system sensor histidine kinase BarA
MISETESVVSPLAEVIPRERDLYEEVCRSYVDLYRVAVKVLDDQGNRLLDLPSRADLCQYIFDIPTCQRACVGIVGSIRKSLPDFRTTETVVCFSGAEYRSVPIHSGTDVVGKVVFGPFLPADVKGPPAQFLAMDARVDAEKAWEHTQAFRRMSPILAEKVAANLATVLEVMSFVGFKGQMTTDMHVESITEAYAELESKNAALEETVQRLSRAGDQRSQFLARVSAELEGPLTNIIGYAEMLSEGMWGEVNDDQAEFLRSIMDQGEQMMSVTQTMGELALIERGQLELMADEVSVADLIERITPVAMRLSGQHDVSVDILPLPADLAPAYVDEERIVSALGHIIANAILFTPAAGRVEISAVPGGSVVSGVVVPVDAVGIAVRDSGVGIAPEHHERIFEPFFTVDSGPDRAHKGSGIGLSIAKAYALAHGGDVRMDSQLDEGSTFVMLLPTPPRFG